MCLRKAARVFPFFVTLGLGITAGFIARGFGDVLPVDPPQFTPAVYTSASRPTNVSLQTMLGLWRGSWGDDGEPCTLEIDRVEGGKFYGTLRKDGFRVAFEGTADPASRQVFLRETKVLNPAPEAYGWSLGNNVGFLSSDGQTLNGTGQDEYGPYTLHAAKD